MESKVLSGIATDEAIAAWIAGCSQPLVSEPQSTWSGAVAQAQPASAWAVALTPLLLEPKPYADLFSCPIVASKREVYLKQLSAAFFTRAAHPTLDWGKESRKWPRHTAKREKSEHARQPWQF